MNINNVLSNHRKEIIVIKLYAVVAGYIIRAISYFWQVNINININDHTKIKQVRKLS